MLRVWGLQERVPALRGADSTVLELRLLVVQGGGRGTPAKGPKEEQLFLVLSLALQLVREMALQLRRGSGPQLSLGPWSWGCPCHGRFCSSRAGHSCSSPPDLH